MDCDDDGEEGGVPWVTVPPAIVTFGVGNDVMEGETTQARKKGCPKKTQSLEKKARRREQMKQKRRHTNELTHLSQK